jgi:hypothetical protein
MRSRCVLFAILILFYALDSRALDIASIDLNNFDFDVQIYNLGSDPDGLGDDATASGTSNGIAWSIGPTDIYEDFTTTDESFVFSSLPNPTDNLHVSMDFTITFQSPVQNLLIVLSNNNCCDAVDFGYVPTEIAGDITNSGSQILLTSESGGLALFTGLGNVVSISHIDSNGYDGFDIAFYANPIPEPNTALLLGIGMMGLGMKRRRRTRRGC